MSLSIGTRIEKWNPDLDFLHAWEVVSPKLSSKVQAKLIQHASVKINHVKRDKTIHFYFACPSKKQILSMSSLSSFSQNINLVCVESILY